MMMFNNILAGIILGIFNGLISKISLKFAINKSDKIFYSVWVAGMFYRLIFLVGAVIYLKYKNSIMILPFTLSLIFSQFIFELKPIKKNGPQRDS
ncbi:MAG: hypothetical protein U9Q34_06245 [Elusimicrobiota bacterium]|nr:hypothetical protein [Elusimicrobiota bacterium]